jgi:hypothetical protein
MLICVASGSTALSEDSTSAASFGGSSTSGFGGVVDAGCTCGIGRTGGTAFACSSAGGARGEGWDGGRSDFSAVKAGAESGSSEELSYEPSPPPPESLFVLLPLPSPLEDAALPLKRLDRLRKSYSNTGCSCCAHCFPIAASNAFLNFFAMHV